MELIDHWSHSANTLLLVMILLAVLVSLVASGLSPVLTIILLCIGLITILARSSLTAYITSDEESKANSENPLDTLKQQYVQGEISEDELEANLNSSLTEKREKSERDRQPTLKEQE